LGAFGEKLRKQREQSGIGLDAISNTTKISTRMLRALEDEHFDQLPGGVFNKGFVRAYARQVGLNEEETIADYLAAVRENQVRENQVRENQIQAHSVSSDTRDRHHDHPSDDSGHDRGRQLLTDDRRKQFRRNEDRRNENRRNQGPSASTDSAARFRQRYPAGSPELPTTGGNHNHDAVAHIPWGKLAVTLLLATFALALWTSRHHREPTPAPLPALASNQTPAAAPVPASTSHSRQQPSAPAPLKPGKTSPAGTLSSAKPSSGAITAESAAAAAAPSANSSPANPATQQSTGQSTASAAPANPSSTFSVLIRADETSWVSITADGKPVAHETLIAPAHTSVRASGEVVVKAGNAAGISFELNGKEIPAQGNEGEVKTYVFDAAGFRVLPQPQSPAAVR
jgi:hypothetical protein